MSHRLNIIIKIEEKIMVKVRKKKKPWRTGGRKEKKVDKLEEEEKELDEENEEQEELDEKEQEEET